MGWDNQPTNAPKQANVVTLGGSFRAGSSSNNRSYAGPAGSMTYDVETKECFLHNGVTPGGIIMGGLQLATHDFTIAVIDTDFAIADNVLTFIEWGSAPFNSLGAFSAGTPDELVGGGAGSLSRLTVDLKFSAMPIGTTVFLNPRADNAVNAAGEMNFFRDSTDADGIIMQFSTPWMETAPGSFKITAQVTEFTGAGFIEAGSWAMLETQNLI